METDENNSENTGEKKEFGNLLDFVSDPEGTQSLDVEVTITEDGKVAVFHNRPFIDELAWVEYDMDRKALEFVLDNGNIRNIGVPVRHELAKYMQNTHQVLMVMMDDESGEPKEGYYIPLIIHKV